MPTPSAPTESTDAAVGADAKGPAASDPRARLDAASATMIDVVQGIDAEQYDLATPCDSMTVGELSEHVVMALRRTACAGRDVPLRDWPIDAADVATGEWADALVAARTDSAMAWADDELLERPTTLPWGTFPGAEVLDVYTNEMTMHAWDLAVATGQQPEWNADVLAASLAVMHQQLPMADRAPIWDAVFAQVPEGVPVEVPFANAVDVSDDAPLIDRLVAWNGRQP